MTQQKLQAMSNFFVKRIFGGIPEITVKYGDTDEEGELGNFFIQANNEYNLDEEDPFYSELLEEAPEYKCREYEEEGLVIKGKSTPTYTDPAWHPILSIVISDKYNATDLISAGTLLHELTHYYCWYLGYDYHDGNRQFEKKLKEFGFPSNFDRKFNKETKQWEDNFDYTALEKYVKEFEEVS